MAVRESLLALLHGGAQHGYQLKTGFEAATGGVWPLNVGQVYTTLDRLERDGLVDVAEEEGQRIYSITPAGDAELGAWWEMVPIDEPPARDELMLRVLMAIEHGPDHALDVITRQRSALHELLAARRRARPGRAPSSRNDDLSRTLITDALLMRAEADLRWLDQCEARVMERRPPKGRRT